MKCYFVRLLRFSMFILLAMGCIFTVLTLLDPPYISFKQNFSYPLEIDMNNLSRQLLNNKGKVDVKPVNDHFFHYIYNPKGLCKTTAVFVLILIKSSVHNFHLRFTIRHTLLKDISEYHPDVKVAFLLGYSYEERFVIENENAVHHDIIQESFIDAYRNNTIKTIMGFNWITKYCRNARYIFFVDDDMMVNIKVLRAFLYKIPQEQEAKLYSGTLVTAGPPARETESRWFISRDDYPFDVYPPYIAGCAILTSQNVVQKFQGIFPYVQYFVFDDVYLGIVAHKLGIVPSQNPFLIDSNVRNFTNLPRVIANHGYGNPQLYHQRYADVKHKSLDQINIERN